MYTHTQTHAHAFIHTLKSLIRTHTNKASTQETTRDANLPIWREFLQEGQSTERSAQRKELLSTEITGAVQPRAKRRTKMREQPNASSPKSRISALARALSLSLARVCVCVCMPGQARGAQRASINMFAAWPQRVECLRRLLYVQHAAMCNMSQWRRHRCCCRPLPPLHTSPFFSTVSTNKQRP